MTVFALEDFTVGDAAWLTTGTARTQVFWPVRGRSAPNRVPGLLLGGGRSGARPCASTGFHIDQMKLETDFQAAFFGRPGWRDQAFPRAVPAC